MCEKQAFITLLREHRRRETVYAQRVNQNIENGRNRTSERDMSIP